MSLLMVEQAHMPELRDLFAEQLFAREQRRVARPCPAGFAAMESRTPADYFACSGTPGIRGSTGRLRQFAELRRVIQLYLIETGTNKAGTVAQIKNKRRSTKFISGHHHETPTSCEAWRGSRETI